MIVVIQFIKLFWKDILIAIILAALSYLAYDYGSLKSKIALQEHKYDIVLSENKKLNTTIDDLKKASDEQQKRVDGANKERSAIIVEMTKTINTLSAQKPPTECKQAIEWAVQNKGDLAWPK